MTNKISQQDIDTILNSFGITDKNSLEAVKAINRAKTLRELFLEELNNEDEAVISTYKTTERVDGIDMELVITVSRSSEEECLDSIINTIIKHRINILLRSNLGSITPLNSNNTNDLHQITPQTTKKPIANLYITSNKHTYEVNDSISKDLTERFPYTLNSIIIAISSFYKKYSDSYEIIVHINELPENVSLGSIEKSLAINKLEEFTIYLNKEQS